VYIKHHLPINKQFSIDSFLDWEGLCWDLAYHYLVSVRLRFRTASASTPAALNRLELLAAGGDDPGTDYNNDCKKAI